MSFGSFAFPSDPCRKRWRPEAEGGLFQHLNQLSHFLRDLRRRLRYGELSRAPLRLLRFQIVDEIVECDWMARAPDPWDIDLPSEIQQRHTTLQALRDALDIRALLFEILPCVESANIRVFRESADYKPEMIISGCLHKADHSARDVHSIVMRAKVLGFRFRMEGDALRKI